MSEENITPEQAEIYNRKACEMVHIFFKEIASIPAEEIYKIASAVPGESEGSTILLDAINRVFTQFMENGEGLDRIYYDSYERTADSLAHTFKMNLKGKLEQNNEALIAQTLNKDYNEVTYTDIANAIVVSEPTPVAEVEGEEVPNTEEVIEVETVKEDV